MMNLKEFSRKYDGVFLISVSDESLTLGKCVWDAALFGKPKFSHAGMPDYIFNAFVDEDIISATDCEAILQRLKNITVVEAEFAKMTLEFSADEALEIDLDQTLKIDAVSHVKKIEKFYFKNAQARVLPNNDRLEIDNWMENLKENHWSEYRTGLRRAYMITKLYYGTFSMIIKKEYKASLNLESKGFTLKASHDSDSYLEYEFVNSKVPFAMKMERIKTL
jgi:hypothetical protein